jgi:hypothetical protein
MTTASPEPQYEAEAAGFDAAAERAKGQGVRQRQFRDDRTNHGERGASRSMSSLVTQ